MPNREYSRRPKKSLIDNIKKSLDELKETVSSFLDEDAMEERIDDRINIEMSDCRRAMNFAKDKLGLSDNDSMGERPRRRRPNNYNDKEDYGMGERPRRPRPNNYNDKEDYGMGERPRRPRPNNYNDKEDYDMDERPRKHRVNDNERR